MTSAGKSAGEQEALFTALLEGGQSADLGELDRAMLAYAVKLTRTPGAMPARVE